MRSTLYRAGSSAVLAWVATALFRALAPSYLQATLNTTSSTVPWVVVAIMLGASAVAQLTAFGREPVSLQVVGLALLAAGLIVLVGGAGAGSIALCAAAAVITGIGQGLAFSGPRARSAPRRRLTAAET